jgi:serpin B
VEEKTQQKIKDLIPGGAVDGASLVLTNAIYFKGDWATPFDKTATANEAFHLTAAKDVQAPLMRKTAHFRYMEKEGSFQAVELPYKNNELSMVVFLPAKADGLAELETSFTAENLKTWLGAMSVQETNVFLPRFKLTWGTKNIATTLGTMGITDAFKAGVARRGYSSRRCSTRRLSTSTKKAPKPLPRLRW